MGVVRALRTRKIIYPLCTTDRDSSTVGSVTNENSLPVLDMVCRKTKLRITLAASLFYSFITRCHDRCHMWAVGV